MSRNHDNISVDSLQKYLSVLEIHNSIGVHTGYYDDAKKEKDGYRMELIYMTLETLAERFLMSCH